MRQKSIKKMLAHIITQTLLIHLIISTTSQDFPAIYGPVVTEVGADAAFIYSSADGNTLFVSFDGAKASEIYANTGYGFQLQQSLEGELNFNIALSKSGSKLICEKNNEGNLYQLMDGKYLKVQTFAFSGNISTFTFSDDDQILLIGFKAGILKIFHRHIMYSEHQSLSISTKAPSTLSITKDLETIATGGLD